jgi:heptosyltransferase-2
VLVVAPSWVGDMVMAAPLIGMIASRPGSPPVDVLAPASVLPLAARIAGVREGLAAPFGHGRFALGERLRLGHTLRGRGYAQSIVLPNSWKSALVPWFAGIGQRTGWVGEFRHGLLNDARRLDRDALPLMAERFAALALEPSQPLPRPLPEPRLRADAARGRALAAGLGLDPERPCAVLCPGAEYGPAKRWPVRHFVSTARALAGRGLQVWLVGSARDAEVTAAIAAGCTGSGAVSDLAGRTALDEAIDLMSLASLVISNDSGLMHVAAALDLPLVALFGSSSPRFTPPLSRRAQVARNPVPCSPCFQRSCPLTHFDCLEKLEPAVILDLAERALATP